MFQNLNNNEEYKEEITSINKINFKNIFQEQNLFLYIISFMVSMVSFNGQFAPFGISMLAACCSKRKPAGLIFLLILIGTLIAFGFKGAGTFILSAIIFLGIVLIIRPNIEEDERNEKQKLGLYVFVASFVVQAIKMFITGFLVYDLISSIVFGIITFSIKYL